MDTLFAGVSFFAFMNRFYGRIFAAALAAAALSPARADGRARAEAAVRESVLRLAAGDVLGAEAQAKAAVDAAPNDPRALQQLALAADAALDFTTAESAASRGLDAGGPPVALLCLRSQARVGRGDAAGALGDARRALGVDPGSGRAFLRRAVAEEALGRPRAETLADYERAAQLDADFGPEYDAARARLAPRRRRAGGAAGAAAALIAAAAAGLAWRRRRARAASVATARARPVLPGSGRLSAEQAESALALAAASAPGAEETRALAESLYERLTGRPAFEPERAGVDRDLGRFAPPSSVASGLPEGIDAFFARALHPEPERRFRTGAELAGAFRSLVRPAVD